MVTAGLANEVEAVNQLSAFRIVQNAPNASASVTPFIRARCRSTIGLPPVATWPARMRVRLRACSTVKSPYRAIVVRGNRPWIHVLPQQGHRCHRATRRPLGRLAERGRIVPDALFFSHRFLRYIMRFLSERLDKCG
jgi:hypothetical protein